MATDYYGFPFKEGTSFLHISDDILHQTYLQELQTHAYTAYLGLAVCLSWNVLAVASLWIHGFVQTKILLLAIAYLVCGVPGAYVSWYRTLCHALTTGNPFMFDRFSLFLLLHTSFSIFAAVSPPVISNGRSLTGILSALDVLDNGGLIMGMFYLAGFVLFCLESLVSIWVMQRVKSFYDLGRRNALEMV